MELVEPTTTPRIGIMIPGQATPPAEPVKLVFANGSAITTDAPEVQSGPEVEPEPSKLILPEASEPGQVVDADGEPTSGMTWQHYVARREFSCVPRIVTSDRVREIAGNEGITDEAFLSGMLRAEQLEDLQQATLEFVGECGEVAELIGAHGVKVLWGDRRHKLIDECGDILFTGTWLIEAWSRNPHPVPDREDEGDAPTLRHLLSDRPIENPLLGATDTELYRFEGEDIHANLAVTILNNGSMKLMKSREFVGMCSQVLLTDTLQLMTFATLTANAAKKLVYQHREQDAKLNIERVMGAFYAVNFLLCLANSNVEEAMIANRAKIDARYPNGYVEGVGGGIRTEG